MPLTEPYKPVVVSLEESAFGGDMNALLPAERDPNLEPFWNRWHNQWAELVSQWFFHGLDASVLIAKQGVDRTAARDTSRPSWFRSLPVTVTKWPASPSSCPDGSTSRPRMSDMERPKRVIAKATLVFYDADGNVLEEIDDIDPKYESDADALRDMIGAFQLGSYLEVADGDGSEAS